MGSRNKKIDQKLKLLHNTNNDNELKFFSDAVFCIHAGHFAV